MSNRINRTIEFMVQYSDSHSPNWLNIDVPIWYKSFPRIPPTLPKRLPLFWSFCNYLTVFVFFNIKTFKLSDYTFHNIRISTVFMDSISASILLRSVTKSKLSALSVANNLN